MTEHRSEDDGKPKPSNDNHPPDGQEGGGRADSSEKLDGVVLSIARLIGRQMAREAFEALRADNDNRPGAGNLSSSEGGDDA